VGICPVGICPVGNCHLAKMHYELGSPKLVSFVTSMVGFNHELEM
jgi:hypothetical protein